MDVPVTCQAPSFALPPLYKLLLSMFAERDMSMICSSVLTASAGASDVLLAALGVRHQTLWSWRAAESCGRAPS